MIAQTKMARSRVQPRRAVILQTPIRNELDMETNNTQPAASATPSITAEQNHTLKEALSTTGHALVLVLDLMDGDSDLEPDSDSEPNNDAEPDSDPEPNGDEYDHTGAEGE